MQQLNFRNAVKHKSEFKDQRLATMLEEMQKKFDKVQDRQMLREKYNIDVEADVMQKMLDWFDNNQICRDDFMLLVTLEQNMMTVFGLRCFYERFANGEE